jgi:protocatechuate 3,4-dioxygenase beta subunit
MLRPDQCSPSCDAGGAMMDLVHRRHTGLGRQSRRQWVRASLAPLGWAWIEGWLVACTRRTPPVSEADAGERDASAASAAPVNTADASAGRRWATGGTRAMSIQYPDPFAGEALGAECTLLGAMTLGPCYVTAEDRQDISEGSLGLPMRLKLRVVDEACRPVPGAIVDVWHTAPHGVYSSADAPAGCTLGDAAALAARYFRGMRHTDEDGVAEFDSCFPGWYSGRTIHVHLTVWVNGIASVTSQLYFDDTLSDEIIAAEPIYADRGPRNTTNQNDSVVSVAAVGDYTLHAERMPDGALLAWKTLVIAAA